MQPLAGSKELLPLGRRPGSVSQPGALRVISEYVIERMLLAGADRICLIVAGDKADLLRYYAQSPWADCIFFVLQPRPAGLCDAVFRATPFCREDEPVLIGLPDTVWHPRNALAEGVRSNLHLVTFPVEHPEDFDAVIEAPLRNGSHGDTRVLRVEVKRSGDAGRRVWGAITAPAAVLHQLAALWRAGGCREQFLGDLFNRWIAVGHPVTCDRAGSSYCDIGTPAGYERALRAQAWLDPGHAAISPFPADSAAENRSAA